MEKVYENDKCPVCYYEYEITNEDQDDYEKVRKYIPICGHKLCVECRDQIVFCGNACCPICRINWENDFKNDDDDSDDGIDVDDESFNSDVFEFREGDVEDYYNHSDDDEEEPPKPTWNCCCNYCKELKLTPDEIEIIQDFYIFDNNPCSGCRSRDISHLI